MSKVTGIYVKFWHFYDARSPNMAMSEVNFEKFYFSLILHLILGKLQNFW